MIEDKNLFGGKSSKAQYVPLTDLEQESIQRLVETKDIQLIVHGFGKVDNPRIIFDDMRFTVEFNFAFGEDAKPVDVWFVDLELRTQAGMTLFKQRMPCVYGGKPIKAQPGVFYPMRWHIMLHSVSPEMVKMLVPGAKGLTSRRQDKDTKAMTLEGNMRLDDRQRKALLKMKAGEDRIRREDLKATVFATKSAQKG